MSKTKRVRKARDLRIHGYLVACCDVLRGERHIRIGSTVSVFAYRDNSKRVADWFAKAAAWVEDGKR